jgi:hypothetical protein
MSEPESKKQKTEEEEEVKEEEDYIPKNILLTGGAGERKILVLHWTST